MLLDPGACCNCGGGGFPLNVSLYGCGTDFAGSERCAEIKVSNATLGYTETKGSPGCTPANPHVFTVPQANATYLIEVTSPPPGFKPYSGSFARTTSTINATVVLEADDDFGCNPCLDGGLGLTPKTLHGTDSYYGAFTLSYVGTTAPISGGTQTTLYSGSKPVMWPGWSPQECKAQGATAIWTLWRRVQAFSTTCGLTISIQLDDTELQSLCLSPQVNGSALYELAESEAEPFYQVWENSNSNGVNHGYPPPNVTITITE